MSLNVIIYIIILIFIILGAMFSIWSFIDTYRIRSSIEFQMDSEVKMKQANERFERKRGKKND